MIKMLRQPFSRVVYSVLLALLFTAGSVQAQDVLNGNGGFENYDLGPVSDTNEWFFQYSEDDATLTIVDDPVHEGNRALSVEVAGIAGSNLQFSNQNIDVSTSGTGTYRYSGWARASEEGAQIQVIGDHHGGSYSWFGNQTFDLTTEWTEMTFEFEVPAESGGEAVTAIRATHVLKNEANVGKTIYLDDVRVWKVEEDGGGPGGEDPTLVASWDFEDDDLGGWFSQNDGTEGTEASIEISDEQAESGTYSLKLVGADNSLQTNLQNGDYDDIQEGDVIRYRVWISEDDLADVNGFQIYWHAPEWSYQSEWLGKDGVTAGEWSTLEVTFPAIEQPVNSIGLQLLLSEGNEASTPTLYVDNITINRPAEEPPAEEPVPVAQWGFNGDPAGWTLEVGDPGNVTVSGEAPPTGWVPLRGAFDDIAPEVGEALVVTGQLELIGGGLPATATTNYPALRYGVYQDSSSAGDLAEGSWSGTAGNHYGYLFTAPSGTGGGVSWQGIGEDGTFGGIRNRTWYSTNGPSDYVLGDTLQQPAGAPASAGTYDFAFSFAPQDGGGMEVKFYLIKDDEGYYWAGSAVDDSLQVTSFNSVNFAISADVSATGLALRDVTVDVGEPITIPAAPTPDAVAPGDVPHAFALEQNYPNPFNPTTTIEYVLDANTHVTLDVYNALGQRVATLVDAPLAAGQHRAQFDARGLASGMYFYRITAGDHIMTRQMTLVK